MNQITLRCGTTYTLDQLEAAGISYVPCSYEKPLFRWGQFIDSERQVIRQSYGRKWYGYKALHEMQGVQIFTGKPTSRTIDSHRAYLVDIDIEARMIDQYPVHTEWIRQVYRDACDGTPCEIQTKSEGSRLSGFSPWYESKRAFQDKAVEGNDKPMLLEIFSLGTLSRIDDRYAMKEGSLLDIPIVPKSAYQEIHAIISEIGAEKQARSISDATTVETCQLDDLDVHFGEDGRSQYFSSQYCQRTTHSSDRHTVQFFKIDNDGILGRCYNCGENWWERPSKQRAKLQRSDNTQSVPTESLDENRDRRETATDDFLTTDTDDTLHILLVKDSTGTGKSHTTLSKSQQHGKRTLMNPPHKALAAQAVEIAREHGYLNPFHLLGREHNWDDSGIADIPVEMRTADLFEKNNCIMVDQIKTYTDKRLAPRTYCEHRCLFRDGCPHLAQYEGLGQRDFVASCTPNLLFDLNMRGYLQSLVTAADEPSDEELAIDAILETESEATADFDFAIVDDYGISGLYTDITFSESDFKALKKAWNGTPTGDFAKLLLKAFEKKKPQKIIKALRKAFGTTTEHHAEIVKNLTLHARTGIIEYAERPKASKETQRLLTEKVVRYTDGGKQFIPVSWEAYEKLTEKGVPSVNPKLLETQEIGEQVRVPHTPTHALIAGVPLDELTPVWQKDATPIEILDIFLKSIGNDRNAPINRTFRTGDPPVAILNFSVPPQAPVGILPQIEMLSATVDPADTRKAFDQQPVEFSDYTGGTIAYADNVKTFQYQDTRLTSGSVFEYPTDIDGKRLLQETPTGLTATAKKRLAKLNEWAKQADGNLTAFISYKEFTTGDPFSEHVNGFDIVTHFDKVTGLNFDGLKYLVVFGYPKVKHEILMEHARKQYASDNNPLPKADPTLCDDNGKVISEYMQLTEVITVSENGYEITERRYKDPRLEKIRHQLSTEKLKQALGRARFIRWKDTTTLLMTNTPVKGFTQRTTLFSDAALNLAETPSEIPAAMDRIRVAEETGDVKAIMETKDVSQRTAERETQPVRKARETEKNATIIRLYHDGHSQSEIERQLKSMGYTTGISRKTIRSVIKIDEQVGKNDNAYKYIPIGDVANAHPPENLDDTGIERVLPQKEVIPTEQVERVPDTQNAAPKTIPLSEYSSLDDETVQLELERCQERNNYNGAAFLRNLLRKRGASDQPPVKKDDTEETILHLFDWDISTVYLRREEISAHTDVSTGLTQKCLTYACEAPNIVCEEVSKDGKTDTI